jgi:DNA repair exonuclease SbcCD nuclease subunit
MKRIISLLLILAPVFLFAQTSIYDIQYTTYAGSDGWSYPSTKNGQTVTTGGIVTATDYSGGRYFIECSNGGWWNGLYVYDNNYSPNIGDSILVTGVVSEYQGYTEIVNLTSLSIESTGNDLPPAIVVPTNEIGWEQYEGLFVEVNNCDISEVFGISGVFTVDDGSGEVEVPTGIYNVLDDGFPLIQNYTFEKILGVVGFYDWERKLYPRNIDDFVSASNEFVLSTDDKFALTTESFAYPVKIGILNQLNTITSYSLKLQYDNTKFEYENFTKTGSISETGSIIDNSTAGNIELNFTGSISCDDISTLVYLNLKPLAEGDADLQFNTPTINGSDVNYVSAGMLEYGSDECDIPIGDTLTIVQRPLLNIPSIVTPDDVFNIVCFAPQSTTNWGVELFYKDIVVPLNVAQSTYDTDLEKWILTTVIPNVDIYELYDLKVTASDGIIDTVTNAVKVIDQFKENYYFIHITDLHLLGHTFYGAPGYETEHEAVDDFNEVINDINLINPEFVLLTGDLINEGELEDFECLRNHTLTMELLEKLEVPVYIVPGNHDLGGWDETPPPQGTARQEWWRFFGWRQREVPPTKTEYLTYDYSFDYGNVHFIGLEAYDNYDSYMQDVYGDESFIPSQMTWLNNDLTAAGDKTKVLFYHYDFKDELNLESLGVDMALWGHTHSDHEDASHPYVISTASVCDGKRAIRVIRVNGSNLQAENSVQTHSSGDMLTLNYNMVNDGSLDSVSATINNKYSQVFSNGLVKFEMPLSNYGYTVANGTLYQIMEKGSIAICYVKVEIPSNNEIDVSIKKNFQPTQINDIETQILFHIFPNPFSEEMIMEYEIQQKANINISVYNMTGQLVKILVNENKAVGEYSVKWNASNSNGNRVKDGTYIYKYMVDGKQISSGQLLFIK